MISQFGMGPHKRYYVPLEQAILAGDKAGAWDLLKGDGTMLAGSATTWVPTGVPVNTTENGFATRTYTATQNDQQPANAAFPASSFTICQYVKLGPVGVAQLAAFGTSGAAAGFSALPFQVQSGAGNLFSYVSDGVGTTVFSGITALQAGSWNFICYSYNRVGGAANNVGQMYVNGVPTNGSSVQALIQPLVSVWTSNGYAGATTGHIKSIRGQFITYKVLSAQDIARIASQLSPY